MGADPNYTTISGYSSGAEMANTLFVAHSETFKGAGFHDGLPYGVQVDHPAVCMNAAVTPDDFSPTCFDAEVIGNQTLDVAKNAESYGYKIDPLSNI